MSADDDDQDLRRLFRELAAEDRQLAQPFMNPQEALRQRGSARRDGRPAAAPAVPARRLSRLHRRPALALAAAVLLAALGLTLQLQRSAPRAHHLASVAEISNWHAPTDFLLHTPGDALLRTVPHFSPHHDHTSGGRIR
jgi:hypothetical protein